MKRYSFRNYIVCAICVLSLALAAFAHTPVSATQSGPDLSAYALPDGTIPVICLNVGDDPDNPVGAGAQCEFCRIAGGFLLPEAPKTFARFKPSCSTRISIQSEDIALGEVLVPGSPPTGPPSSET